MLARRGARDTGEVARVAEPLDAPCAEGRVRDALIEFVNIETHGVEVGRRTRLGWIATLRSKVGTDLAGGDRQRDFLAMRTATRAHALACMASVGAADRDRDRAAAAATAAESAVVVAPAAVVTHRVVAAADALGAQGLL